MPRPPSGWPTMPANTRITKQSQDGWRSALVGVAVAHEGSPWAAGTVCISLAFWPEVAPGHSEQCQEHERRQCCNMGPHLYLFPQAAFTPRLPVTPMSCHRR